MRPLVLAALLALPPCIARAQDPDAGLRAAINRFPPLILGPGVREADGTAAPARSCPAAAGGRVEQRGGPTISYDGADPASAELCLLRFDGQPAKAWFGIWLVDWPGADKARDVLRRLIGGRTGDTEGIVVRMTADRTYYDVLRNEGLEDIWLAGDLHHTVKLSHYREGAPPNGYRSVVTGWKDVDTGMMVYVTYQHISGTPETETPLDPTLIVSPR